MKVDKTPCRWLYHGKCQNPNIEHRGDCIDSGTCFAIFIRKVKPLAFKKVEPPTQVTYNQNILDQSPELEGITWRSGGVSVFSSLILTKGEKIK